MAHEQEFGKATSEEKSEDIGAEAEQPCKRQRVICINPEQTESNGTHLDIDTNPDANNSKLRTEHAPPIETSKLSDPEHDANNTNTARTILASSKVDPNNNLSALENLLSPMQLSNLLSFSEGAERRLDGHAGTVLALAECMGHIYSGGKDDAIRVWSKETLRLEKVMELEHGAAVWSMTAWKERLMTGHDDGKVRVWDLSAGVCEQVLEGHEDGVNALAVCGSRLASASDDCTVRLWAMGADPGWQCERTLEGHRGLVSCLAVWEGWVISGSWDDSIRVWDAETGELVRTLAGHADTVMALLVQGTRLFSASVDGKLRVWALDGDCAALRSLAVYPPGAGQWVRCLAASPAGLVAGSFGPEDAGRRFEVQVLDPDTLEARRTVRLPEGQRVLTLLGTAEGEVWGAVGDTSVAVWGRQ